MKVFVVLETYKTDFEDIFPNVVRICDTVQDALEVIADKCDTAVEEVEKELEENNCYSMSRVHYTIYKYVD